MALADDAKAIYATLRKKLEAEHLGEFIAIEPESKTHFLGKTFVEAALAAKQAIPDRMPFVIRIGSEAAFHIGAGIS